MTAPWMGGLQDDQVTGLCAFSPKPGDLACNVEATWHGVMIDAEAAASMASCDGHLAIMATIAEYVHPHVHPCSIPGSLFSEAENRCYTDWDEQAEFTQASVPAGAS